MVVESGMNGVFMDVNWLDVMLVIVAMIQLGMVGFNVLVVVNIVVDEERIVMLNILKLMLSNLTRNDHLSMLLTQSRVKIMELKSRMNGVFMEVNWLDVMLVIVAMIQLRMVGFNVLIMMNVFVDEERIDMIWF
jgi:hypothetical protein